MGERSAGQAATGVFAGALGIVWVIHGVDSSLAWFGPDLQVLAYGVGVLAWLAGVGVYYGHRWAYVLAFAIAIASLTVAPMGTLFGVFTIVVLLSRDTREGVGGVLPGRPLAGHLNRR